jgi:hypothetical protein
MSWIAQERRRARNREGLIAQGTEHFLLPNFDRSRENRKQAPADHGVFFFFFFFFLFASVFSSSHLMAHIYAVQRITD